MARFADVVGFGVPTEVRPGVIKDVITEKPFLGNVTSQAIQAITSDQINDQLTADVTIEVIADWIDSEDISAIRYAGWAGTKWKVTNVKPQGVRLLLRLGGVYNGSTATVSD